MSHPPEQASDGLAQVFLNRAQRALQELAHAMSASDLEAAASEASDTGVILKAFESSSALTLLAHDPLLESRLRGLRIKQDLLQREGGTLGASEVAELLGISRQAVSKRVKARTLLALPTARHGHAYPAWQLVDGGVLPDLPEVLQALDPEMGPWMTLAFMLGEHVALGGRSPLQALREHDLEAVLRAARTHGEHIAV
ncbi:MAG: hypothetical protein AB1Z98_32695 [Nannocystaceae bacterium]